MRAYLVVSMLCTMIAVTPTIAGAQGNNCQFPGTGVGVGGTPGTTPGTFPGGGATGGTFPGGNCGDTGGTLTASEPLALGLTALGLFGASLIRRRRQ
jgi:hypothetical protein